MARRQRDPRIKTEAKKDGSTRYRVVVSVTVAGVPRQKKGRFDTIKAAEEFIREVEAAAQHGTLPTGPATTFDALCEEFLQAKAATVRPGTLTDYTSYLVPYRDRFGSKRVADLTATDVEAVVLVLVQAGRTRRTVSAGLGIVRQVLNRAVRDRRVASNVALLVESAGKASAEGEAYDLGELQRIRAAVHGNRWEHAFLLMLAGMRRSEVMALDWTDWDPKTGSVQVTKSRPLTKSGGTTIEATKTTRGVRRVYLDERAAATVERIRRDLGVIAGPMVADDLGLPLHPDQLSDAWKTIAAAAKVRPLDLRALRRSSVTEMRRAGVPDHVVARHHGHDESVMRKHYSVVHDQDLQDAVRGASKVLRTS